MVEPSRARPREADEKTDLAIALDGAVVRADQGAQQSPVPPSVRDEALAFLDRVAAPLTKREVEAALRRFGVNRARAHVLANCLKDIMIIAITDGGTDDQ
jgi:hypothetical protein